MYIICRRNWYRMYMGQYLCFQRQNSMRLETNYEGQLYLYPLTLRREQPDNRLKSNTISWRLLWFTDGNYVSDGDCQ